MSNPQTTYKVAEIFGPTIQGEGPEIGTPCYFIRFGGCDFRCTWCDSLHAVLPQHVKALPSMGVEEILEKLQALPKGAYHVVLSGGNPLVWDLTPLIHTLHLNGYTIAVETQGTIYKEWVTLVDKLIVSPKPPSSGMEFDLIQFDQFIGEVYDEHQTNVTLKFVVFDEIDAKWALKVLQDISYAYDEIIYFSIGTNKDDTREMLIERYLTIFNLLLTLEIPYLYRVLPQFHVLLWGHKLGV